MTTKHCRLNQIETSANGDIGIRIAKLAEDGTTRLGWHRSMIPHDLSAAEITAQLAAVDKDLTAQGYGSVTTEDWDRVRKELPRRK